MENQDTTLPAELPTQHSQVPPKGKNRKSRNVKLKSAEKYREHVNDIWQRNRDIEQARKYGYTLPFMGVEPQKIDPPIMEVDVNVNQVDQIIEATHAYATETMKVVSKPDDVQVLKTVASCQIRSKILYSHKNNESEFDIGMETWMNYISTHFNTAIEPIAYFIDNIGTTQFEEQIIVPTLPDDTVASYPPPSGVDRYEMSQVARCEPGDAVYPTGIVDDNGMETNIVVPAALIPVLRREGSIDAAGVLDPQFLTLERRDGRLVYQRVGMSLDVLAQKYQDVINRYTRRVRGKIRSLALKEACGKLTQLVGSELIADHMGRVDAWCIRKVDDATMVAGAMMKLGVTQHHEHMLRYAIKRRIVSRSQGIGRLVALLG